MNNIEENYFYGEKNDIQNHWDFFGIFFRNYHFISGHHYFRP